MRNAGSRYSKAFQSSYSSASISPFSSCARFSAHSSIAVADLGACGALGFRERPELLESIAVALGVSVNALKDYGVENAGDLMSLLVRLEDSFGIVPSADGTGLSLNAKAPHAAKAATAIKLWAEKRAQLENGEIDADEYEDWKASL